MFEIPEPAPIDDADREATQIHKLDISDADAPAAYRASGRVFGHPLNQFSLGEHEGALRIATTEDRWQEGQERVNHLFVLTEGRRDGAAGLEVSGQVNDIAEGERIYAVRVMGDRGFMVTFRQVDPLFTLDLSDPADPQLVGELKVPGFSTYLHPFGDEHLIGIGQSATEEGQITGMQLSLFDVSDFGAPSLAHAESLGQGWSEALYDHHAFTYWAPLQTLMVPVSLWNEEVRRAGLEFYRVSEEDGFTELGFIDHSAMGEDRWVPEIRRSLIIGDAVVSMSDLGLQANDIEDLEPLARAEYPEDDHGGRDLGDIDAPQPESQGAPSPDQPEREPGSEDVPMD